MYKILGRWTASHPWIVCLAWLLTGLLLTWIAPRWDAKALDDDIRFLPERCPSVRGYQLLKEAFPKDVFASKAIFAVERLESPLSPEDFALVDKLVHDLQALREEDPDLKIGNIVSHRDSVIGKRLTSADGHCTLIQVSLGTPFLAMQTRTTLDRAEAKLRERLAEAGDDPPRLMATGPAGIGRDLTGASATSLDGTTLATILLVVVVLLFVYRAPLLALVPLATIAISVWVSLELLALMTLVPGVHLVNVSKIFAIVILYGSGTDYCLFLISRYQEELAAGHSVPGAIRRSVGGVGEALAASAGTVICGLGLMGFAEFAKVRCAGPAIALSLAVALAASLTLAPAILRIFGRVVFWPSRGPSPEMRLLSPESGAVREPLWDRISRGVVARPLLVWSVAVLALAPLAILGLRTTPNYKPTGELSPASASVQGMTTIQKRFTAGEIGPVNVLLAANTDWNSPEGREIIAHLSRGFSYLPNVAEVRSLTQPLGTPLKPPAPEPKKPAKNQGMWSNLLKTVRKDLDRTMEAAIHRGARDFYVAKLTEEGKPDRFVTRLDVVLRSDPYDAAGKATLDEIQIWLKDLLPERARQLGDVQAECYGVTVGSCDLAEITESDRRRVNGLVLSGIFLILLFLVRRLWMAVYLLATVLFSYYATLGATALMGTFWAGRPLGDLDWRVPFFLFTILVAVGEDYNIFLMSRVLEEKKRYGEVEGMRRALAHTGGTITSCGLIMAGTFATLMLAGLGTLVQIGFALAFGVLIDTFIVRPFLVPAFALLLYRWTSGGESEEKKGQPSDAADVRPTPQKLRQAG